MLAVHGVDITKVKYVEAGWPTWGTALAAGQGDAALAWEGLRAEWIGSGLDFEYWLGVQQSPLFANTYVVRAADLDDPDKKAFLDKYLRAWSMGLEFAYHNPMAAVHAVFEQFPTLASNIGPELGAHLDPAADQRRARRHVEARRLGRPRHGGLADLLRPDLRARSRSPSRSRPRTSAPMTASRPANDFDHDKVKADAAAYELPADLAAVDIENVKAHLFDQAVPA